MTGADNESPRADPDGSIAPATVKKTRARRCLLGTFRSMHQKQRESLVTDTRGISEPPRRPIQGSWFAVLLITLLVTLMPGLGSGQAGARAMIAPTPSWMDADTAARLELDFDVLVPGWIPAPFSEQPSATATGGFYELYWVIIGGDPTFLDVTGQVGGDIPDFSWHDRNNELQQNGEVGGYAAYRDLTPIYDNVYWQVGDVVYTVSSQGLTGTDSLSLANALVRVEPDVEEVPPPSPPAPAALTAPGTVESGGTISLTITNGNGATLSASDGTFPDTGASTYAGVADATVTWTAPVVNGELTATFSLVEPDTGSWLAGATTVVVPATTPTDVSCPQTAGAGEQVVVTISGTGNVGVDASAGNWPAFGANLDFDGDAGGGSLSGRISGDPVSLLWQAPETSGELDATISVSGMSGMTVASCVISVGQAAAVPTSTSTESSRPAATTPATDESVGPTPTTSTTTRGTRTPTATPASARTGVASPRNRPARSAGSSTATPASVPTPASRVRSPESDGTGGPIHPRFVGAPEGAGNEEPLVAPTNAPMPPAPREIRDGATLAQVITPTPLARFSGDAVTAVVGPDGGTLRHPNGATLSVPAGTFLAETRVALRPVSDRKIEMGAGLDLIDGTGYDITALDLAGREIRELARPVTLVIPIAAGTGDGTSSVYSIEMNTITKVDSVTTGTRLSASLVHFSRFAAGSPSNSASLPGWLIPWLAVGVVALLILAASTVAGTLQRRRATVKRRPHSNDF